MNSFFLPIISSTSGLMRGSPPVRRILSTPSWTKRRARVIISDVDRSWLRCVSFTPFSGMQYWPENGKRVEILIRYLRCNLPLNTWFNPTLSVHILFSTQSAVLLGIWSFKVKVPQRYIYIPTVATILKQKCKSLFWLFFCGHHLPECYLN